MPAELLPGLGHLLQGWVVKKTSSLAPQRLTCDEVEQLAAASIETLAQKALGEVHQEWGSLADLTQGWIVQRVQGTAPSVLGAEDYRQLVRYALECFTQRDSGTELPSQETGTSVQDLIANENIDENEVLPDGRNVRAVLMEDPFYFAREHLALSL